MNDLARTFKALSDETRLRILKLLEGGELCVCDIVAGLGMVQPKVSFHLGVLKKAKLLRDRKEGKWMHYRIDDSEMFNRLLLLSVLERVPGAESGKDRERLDLALKGRAARECSGAPVCCPSRIRDKIK